MALFCTLFPELPTFMYIALNSLSEPVLVQVPLAPAALPPIAFPETMKSVPEVLSIRITACSTDEAGEKADD